VPFVFGFTFKVNNLSRYGVEGLTARVKVVPIGVHALSDVVPQLVPLKTSMNVLVASRLLPPADIAAISMLMELQPAGVVNVYHTSYLVPAQAPVIPELVALYKVPDVFTQEEPGVRVEGELQSSDCAAISFDKVKKQIVKMLVRAFVSDMVFQGF